jgi:hypothetical protein
MSDIAVKTKTGKNWKDWFAVLDKAGARKMNHQEIVKLVSEKYEVGPWWQQMVTVSYEQARGLREKYQKPAGYQISVSRTVNAPVAKLYKSFADARSRSSWLPEKGFVVRTKTADRSMRVSWNDNKTSLEINFYPKGRGQDSGCRAAQQASRCKIFGKDENILGQSARSTSYFS